MGARHLKSLKFNIVILILIVVLGVALRLYRLDSVPPGLTWDEAALGYNAYSISQTLRDEYGNFLPLTLKSFGDYKPAIYSYLSIPFIILMGLNEWAVRLPSVLAGIGLIIVSYLIIKEIFKNEYLSLSVAFFAAISPLSIQFSRAGFESNVAVLLNVLALYLFLKGLRYSRYFYISAASFTLSMLCYQGSKIFVPMLFIGLAIFFRKKIKLNRNLIWSLVTAVLAVIIVYFATFFLGQSDRVVSQNLFAYPRTEEQIISITKEDGLRLGSLQFEILHGEWWAYLKGVFERYFIYFSPKILFVEGDYSPRHSVPDLGILNFYALIFIPFGFYLLCRKKDLGRNIILFWLFTSTIPAVLSRDLISMVRALNFMFPLFILEGFGFYYLVWKINQSTRFQKPIIASGLLVLVTINLIFYLDFYFVHLPRENSQGWLYGYREVIKQISDTSKYDKVVITDFYGQPYIYYLFYTKYPPPKFQAQAKLEQKTVDVGTIRRIDNIEFRPISWPSDRGLENTLFIGTKEEIPEQDILSEKKSRKVNEINFLNGNPAFKIVENRYD